MKPGDLITFNGYLAHYLTDHKLLSSQIEVMILGNMPEFQGLTRTHFPGARHWVYKDKVIKLNS